MTDPRNIAHDKKVAQEKKHQHLEVVPAVGGHAVQPGRKPHQEPKPEPVAEAGGDGAVTDGSEAA
jgi:hypothetical protein